VEFDPPPSPPDIISAPAIKSWGFFMAKNLGGGMEIYPLKANSTLLHKVIK
jgi:hypothetical protein